MFNEGHLKICSIKYNLKTNLMEKVKEIIILTMRAGKEKINKNNRTNI